MLVVQLFLACAVAQATVLGLNRYDSHHAQAATIFSLRQSFYHGLSEDESSVHFFNHGSQHYDGQGYGTSRALSLLVLARPASVVQHKLVNYVDSSQTTFVSDANPEVGKGPVEPNITDKATVVNLAKMTSDAYYRDPSVPGWLNLTDGFNRSQSFGWQKDGLRGHLFANADNSTVVVAFKGTTIDPRDPSRNHDRENDNVLFSCCCATQRKASYWYGSVCDCRHDTFACNQTCLTEECGREDRYYAKAKEVVLNVSSSFPHAQLWMVGHSLGGAMASLVGMTFHYPVVTFEAIPERLPALRLGLQMTGDNYFPAYHFGNTADPIYMGACNGYTSSCPLAGYALESACFTGKWCVYNTTDDKGWHMSVLNHQINTVIDQVLENYDTVPPCTVDSDCFDCFNWSFFK